MKVLFCPMILIHGWLAPLHLGQWWCRNFTGAESYSHSGIQEAKRARQSGRGQGQGQDTLQRHALRACFLQLTPTSQYPSSRELRSGCKSTDWCCLCLKLAEKSFHGAFSRYFENPRDKQLNLIHCHIWDQALSRWISMECFIFKK